MSTLQFSEQSAHVETFRLDNAQGTSQFDLEAANTFSFRYDQCYLTNTDAIDHVVDFLINHDGTPALLGSVNVPSGSGVGGVAPVEAFSVLQGIPAPGVLVGPHTQMSVQNEVGATVAGEVDGTLFGGTL
jgi:hypothetical protein